MNRLLNLFKKDAKDCIKCDVCRTFTSGAIVAIPTYFVSVYHTTNMSFPETIIIPTIGTMIAGVAGGIVGFMPRTSLLFITSTSLALYMGRKYNTK